MTRVVDIPRGSSTSSWNCDNTCFVPAKMEIEIGDTVKWRNLDNTAHTVTSTASTLFDSGNLLTNIKQNPCFPYCSPTFSHVFNQDGIYNYHCKIHSWMTGRIIVTGIGTGAEVFTSGEGGTGFIDKKQNLVIVDKNVLVKIYGKVINPKQGSGFVFMTTTHPDGHISDGDFKMTKTGYYETYINVEYADRGKYSVDLRYDSKNIGTLTFEVVKYSDMQESDIFDLCIDEDCIISTPQDIVVTVETDLNTYEKGSTINIYGTYTYNTNPSALTFQIIDPKNNILTVDQLRTSAIGIYAKKITADGQMWKFEGDYTVKVNYVGQSASTTFAFTIPNPVTTTSKTSTFLKLDSLDNTFTSQGPNSQADVTYSGQLLTGDRKFYITDTEIKLVFTGFTLDEKDYYKITTDDEGKFELAVSMPIGESYGVQAVYDGSSKFNSSKSQTEYFTVNERQTSQSQPQPQPPIQSSGGSDFNFMWILVILAIVVGGVAVVIISKNKKKTAPQRKTFGAKQPRKRRITPQPPVGVPSSVDGPSTYGYFECPNCHEPSAPQGKLGQNPDGSQFCTKCGWRS